MLSYAKHPFWLCGTTRWILYFLQNDRMANVYKSQTTGLSQILQSAMLGGDAQTIFQIRRAKRAGQQCSNGNVEVFPAGAN